MKNIAIIVGILSIIAAAPLFLVPYAPNSGKAEAAQSNVQAPLGQLRGFSKETNPLAPIAAEANANTSDPQPITLASLEPRKLLPEIQKNPATGVSASVSSGWKHSALQEIDLVQSKYGDLIQEEAQKNGLDPKFVTAIIVVESGGDPNALSNVGAQGLMQVMPVAKVDTGISGDLWNPTDNIEIGTAYLAQLKNRYGFTSPQAIAVAYNMGPNSAKNMSQSAISNHGYAKKVSFVLNNL
ncbi:MAG TPA: lytic transglycosylase domain-containing protein [Candidatus Paceibacterota bacterium]|nr:lytic transglycosylase domain-containing protein [Candidatus Paceibacterota bacterium]